MITFGVYTDLRNKQVAINLNAITLIAPDDMPGYMRIYFGDWYYTVRTDGTLDGFISTIERRANAQTPAGRY